MIELQERYEMHEGQFRIPEEFPGPSYLDGRYRLADVYHIKIDPELVVHVGVVPGCKVILGGNWALLHH